MEKPRLAGVFFRLFKSRDGCASGLEPRDTAIATSFSKKYFGIRNPLRSSEKQISCSQHELVIRQAPRIGGRSSGVSAGP